MAGPWQILRDDLAPFAEADEDVLPDGNVPLLQRPKDEPGPPVTLRRQRVAPESEVRN